MQPCSRPGLDTACGPDEYCDFLSLVCRKPADTDEGQPCIKSSDWKWGECAAKEDPSGLFRMVCVGSAPARCIHDGDCAALTAGQYCDADTKTYADKKTSPAREVRAKPTLPVQMNSHERLTVLTDYLGESIHVVRSPGNSVLL